MRFPLLLCVLSSLLLSCILPVKAEGPLRIAIDVPYPPFAFLDEQGNLTGFDIDLSKALCSEMKRECEFKIVPFDDLIPSIVNGNADIAVAGLGYTKERAALVDFSDRYYRSHSIFIEKPGTVPALSKEGLTGRKIGVQAGTIQESYLNQEYKDVATIVTFQTFEELLAAVHNDRIDTALVDGLPTYAYLRSPEGSALETLGEPIKSGMLVGASYIGVSKKTPEITQQLNAAIQTLRTNGEYGKINRKYFDFDIY